jgi:hypothetical protein
MAASVQDRDGEDHAAVGVPVHPVRFVYADAGFAGQSLSRIMSPSAGGDLAV